MPKQLRYRRLRDLLHKRFPAAFPARGQPGVPLQVGILHDLARPEPHGIGDLVEAREISLFLHGWTGRQRYLQALVAGTPRRNLRGEAMGLVTLGDEDAARNRLEKAKRRAAEAERQAGRGA